MFRLRDRDTAATVPGPARRNGRRPRQCWNPELERLEIRITPATRIWSGAADALWTTAANWDVLPVANDDLVFPALGAGSQLSPVNDFAAGTDFGSITLGGSGYTLSGNAVDLTNGFAATYSGGTSIVNLPVTLGSGAVDVAGGGTLNLTGVVSGASGIIKMGEGRLGLTMPNLYAGATSIASGTLAISNSSALGSTLAGTTVAPGATLEVIGTINTGEPVSIAGSGVGGAGALLNGAGNNVVQSVSLTADATIGVANGTFMLIPSALTGGAGIDLIKAGGGVLDILAAASYPGTTTIEGGTLALEGSVAGPITINPGSTFAGAGGTARAVTSLGGTLNPGFSTSPYVSDTGNLSLDSASTFLTALNGNVPGNGTTGYGQVLVTGSVALGGATLSLSIGGGYTPAAGDSLVIISNDGIDAINGTFAGLSEGAYVSLGFRQTFRISYQGGTDGNDVVLDYVLETTTTLNSSANPSSLGQGVTFTATVASDGVTPTGTVSFFDGATPLASNVTLVNGVATTSAITGLTTGTHSITAVYGGDNFNNAGTSTALSQVVSRAGAATVVTASPNPSVFGQSVTFTATVTAVAPATGTPTGTLTFFDGVNPLGTVPLINGVATLQTSTLAAGSRSITASYTGDATFDASSSVTTNQEVTRASLAATLGSSANPSVFGQGVMLTATFIVDAPGAGSPTGTVTFFDGATSIGTATLDDTGAASIVASGLGVGTHSIVASYSGNASFNASDTPSVLQSVGRASTTATVAASANPSVSGESVTFTAAVSAISPGFGNPGGTVTFLDGMTVLGTGVLVNGVATLSAPLTAGSHSIMASYAGDANFDVVTSVTTGKVVDRAAPSLQLQAPTGSSAFGQPLIFTAFVSAAAPGAGTPTGTVTFFDGVTPIGTATLDGSGMASVVASGLGVGTHSIVASYSGDPEFNPGDSASATQVVARAETRAGSVISSAPQTFFGQEVTFTATFSATALGDTPMTGTVSFFEGETLLGTAPLVASGTSGSLVAAALIGPKAPSTVSGRASLSTSALGLGNHVIRAVYSGDFNYSSATSATPVSVQVVPTTTSTTLTAATTPRGTTLTAKVAVTSPGDPTVAGTVTFSNGTTPLGTAPVVDGVATLDIGTLPPGEQTLSAVFSGGETSTAGGSTGTFVLPTATVTGLVFLDTNADGVRDAGEPGLAGRVVFLDRNGDGTLDAGDPTATTAADGSFSFPVAAQDSGPVVEATDLDTSRRYVVAQSRTLADGSVTVGVVPFSPIAAVPVVPNPFITSSPTDANTAFVQSLYRAVLGRSGDARELQDWLDRMGQGMDRAGVTWGFVNSTEHRRQQVEGFYRSFLGRSTDPSSQTWIDALQAGTSEEAVAEAILNSEEYQSAHRDQDSFVRDLYLDVLGRQGDGAGVADTRARLDSGAGRASIVSQFVQSAEAVDQILEGFYSSYLRRVRDASSRTWADDLNSTDGSATSVAMGILASDEFFEASRPVGR